jgi:hypothetical protein
MADLRGMFMKTVDVYYAGHFTSDNDPRGIENATYNTFPK